VTQTKWPPAKPERFSPPTFDFVSLDEPSQVSEATLTGVLAFGNADDPVAK